MQSLSQTLLARLITTFSRDKGQTMAEYGVILTMITAAIFVAVALLSGQIVAAFTSVANLIN